MSNEPCPFCSYGPERCFLEEERIAGIWDAYPVSPGHALLITRRHVSDWFSATAEEKRDLFQAIDRVKEKIDAAYRPDGYNVGFNAGIAAGQTVFHLHVHILPRYKNDVRDPRGGIRHVVPGKGNYLSAARASSPNLVGLPHSRPLVVGGDDDPLLSHLVSYFDRAKNVDIAVAFSMDSGVRLIGEHLRDVLNRGGRVRIVTGDYMGVTQPEALLKLLDLQGDVHLRVYESGSTSFHPKAYIVLDNSDAGVAFVGSSNLSGSALRAGVEWNYRVISSSQGSEIKDVTDAFEELFNHPRTRLVNAEWVASYARRRVPPRPTESGVDDRIPEVPNPHPIQREALRALAETRSVGNVAGLVVLATGLGKTWLSAFDSDNPEFRRILFVAHREEILSQAMRTFRAIRPKASFGYYTGSDRMREADVLFASIQTIGRQQHMQRFGPKEFDYVVIDEFHHAAAPTYRRLIGYLEPKFLLGLTATPERTDGGDLLALCDDNLVYRRDVSDGIRGGLLCPYAYFGVPDAVDYENIPWRSGSFDEEALTSKVATDARAQNALEQLKIRGGGRTIGFCVSQRHADFMAKYFCASGLRAVSVHAGSTSAPRAHSLDQLKNGELDIVFAVDMFNEGVDLPNVETILMLRPTESRVLWLQQFGRGLRYQPNKTLKVIDYIGNHRVFLNKARALLSLGEANSDVEYALKQYEDGTLELPPGCSVTYDLEVVNILRALVQPASGREALIAYYEEFRDRVGSRPSALEAYQEGYNPTSARAHHGSWFALVRDMGDLSKEQIDVWNSWGDFLGQLEVTPMTKSYKMVLLLALLGENAFPGAIAIDRLTERFGNLAKRRAALRTEVGDAIDSPAALQKLLIENPIDAWVGGQGMSGVSYFSFDGRQLVSSPRLDIAPEIRESALDMLREIVEWRLTAYLRRANIGQTADRILCRVSHSGDKPILFLPDRTRYPGIPEGWKDVSIEGGSYQAKFVKVAVNVLTRVGSEENVLPSVLRKWFGQEAGNPGRTHQVAFSRVENGYVLSPAKDEEVSTGPELWKRYVRDDAPKTLGFEFRGWEKQSGIFQRKGLIALFVTLEKGELPESHRYKDEFLSPTEFQWQSQNRNAQASELGQSIHDHRERAIDVHLFVRRKPKLAGRTQLFVYCGKLDFQRWEGERPITVWWRLSAPVPPELFSELKVPAISN